MSSDGTDADDRTDAVGPRPAPDAAAGTNPLPGAHRRPDDTPPAGEQFTPGPASTEAMPVPSNGGVDGWVLGNRYRVVDRLGEGGMAEVFRAHDELLDRDVAVKVFRAVPATPDTAVRKERQHAELRALAQLNHPNLITLYDGSLTERPAYLVIELIDGLSLGHRIEQGPLPEPEVRDIGRQVADALAYVHHRGMVHRDVKPANILLGTDATSADSTTRVRLSDFGIVRLLGSESMTSVGSTLGTASYLAPEQTRGSAVGPPADIYALGLTLIEALSGQRSFEGPPLEAAMARLHRDPVIPDRVAGPWPRLLAAMTAREPSMRPTAAQVSQALRTTTANAPTGLLTTLPPDHGTTASIPPAVAPMRAESSPRGPSTASYPAGPPPPVRRPPPTYPPDQRGPRPEDEPPRRGIGGYLIAAAIILVILIVAAILLFVPSSNDGSTNPTDSTSITPSSSSSSRQTTRNVPANPGTDQPTTQQSQPSSPPSTDSTSQQPPSTENSTPSTATTSQSTSTTASTSTSGQADGPGAQRTKPGNGNGRPGGGGPGAGGRGASKPAAGPAGP